MNIDQNIFNLIYSFLNVKLESFQNDKLYNKHKYMIGKESPP